MESNEVIRPILQKKLINNSAMKVREFWESSNGNTINDKVDVTTHSLELIKDASQGIYLYSPKITNPELKIELEEIKTKGVFTYALTSSLEMHRSTFNYGIMREKKDIDSTFIIVDPLSKNARGIWFKGELTSKSKNTAYILELDKVQIKELWAQFCYYYWKSEGNELIFGKVRDTMSLNSGALEINPSLSKVFRTETFEQKLEDEVINEIWASRDSPENLWKFQSDAETLVVELHENLKSKLYFNVLKEKKVYGSSNIPFTILSTDKSFYALCKDIGFKCNETQKHSILKQFTSWPWTYIAESTISNIQGSIIEKSDSWDNLSPKIIPELKPYLIDDINANTLEEWLNPKEPVIDKKPILARNIEYKWSVKPPIKPNSSKEDKLIQRWDNFEKEFKKEIKKALTDIEKAILKEKGFEKIKNIFIAKSTSWKDYSNDLNSYLQKDWRYEDTIDVKKAIERLEEIKSRVSGDLTYLNKKNSQTENQTKEEKDNKEVIKEQSKEQSKNVEKDDELDYFYDKKDGSNLKNMVPENPIPRVGKLYADGDKKYLVIKYINEIPRANAIKDRYRAKVVADGSV